MDSKDNFVKISHLHFQRGEQVIFDDVSIDIPRSKITAIMGPSGSGKTTMLQLIGAQLKPSKGEVLVNDIDIHSLDRNDLYKARRQIGMLFQKGGLFTNLNVFENVAFPLREHTKLPEDMLHDLVLIQLEAVGLRGARELMPSALSGGMARRVALARAMVLNPKLMMYDEPFTGQDPVTMGILMHLIKRLNDILGLTSIIVSHDVRETASIADEIYIIANQKIVGQGSAKEIFTDKNPWVKQFVYGLPDGVMPFHYPAIDYKKDLGL